MLKNKQRSNTRVKPQHAINKCKTKRKITKSCSQQQRPSSHYQQQKSIHTTAKPTNTYFNKPLQSNTQNKHITISSSSLLTGNNNYKHNINHHFKTHFASFSTINSNNNEKKQRVKTTPSLSSSNQTAEDTFFGSTPPAPPKEAYEDIIQEMPNYINKQLAENKKPLLSLTLPEMETAMKELGLEKYRAKQIFQWIYQRGATDFDQMTNLSKKQIALLKEQFFIFPIDVKYAATATDGTRKYVNQVEKRGDKLDTIETVFIPRIFHELSSGKVHDKWDLDPEDEIQDVNVSYDVNELLNFQEKHDKLQKQQEDGDEVALKRNPNPNNSLFVPDFSPYSSDRKQYDYESGTVCFSSQIGCSQSCTFCHTGSMDKKNLRNLSTGEIIAQILAVKHDLNDWPGKRPDGRERPIVGSLVAMGQGEFGNNMTNGMKALEILMHPDGLNFGRRHITISTSGVVPAIDKLATLPAPPNLAISLHATNDELRSKIMPINKTFNLNALMAACRDYPGAKKSRKITWEYIMLNGVNDSEQDAKNLLDLVDGIPSLVNCIPFNPWGNCSFDCSSMNRMRRFIDVINNTTHKTGVRATLRKTRGQSESSACGTLNSQVSTSLLKQNKIADRATMNKIIYKHDENGRRLQHERDMQNLPHLVHEATKL